MSTSTWEENPDLKTWFKKEQASQHMTWRAEEATAEAQGCFKIILIAPQIMANLRISIPAMSAMGIGLQDWMTFEAHADIM